MMKVADGTPWPSTFCSISISLSMARFIAWRIRLSETFWLLIRKATMLVGRSDFCTGRPISSAARESSMLALWMNISSSPVITEVTVLEAEMTV